MSLGWYSLGINSARGGLDPLLPHVAGVIENMEEATITDIKTQVEKDLNGSISWPAIINALENGCRLGLFNMEREFKVCREFTSRGVPKTNHLQQNIMFAKEIDEQLHKGRRERTLMDYVRMQREKRRRKHHRAKAGRNTMAKSYFARAEIYPQLCQRCKKSIDKERSLSGMAGQDSEMSFEEDDIQDRESIEGRGSSSASEMSEPGSKSSGSNKKVPQKSRLLVEKNPLETEPPYCDIFT